MRIIKTLFAVVLSSMFSASAMAQDCCGKEGACCGGCNAEAIELGYYPQPYGFVQVQGGVNTIFSPGKQFNPTFSVGAGYMFSPAVGLRLHVNGYEAKNGFRSVNDKYTFKYINSNIDAMFNLTNLIKKNTYNKFNVYLVAGVGLAYAWDNKQFNNIVATKPVAEDVTNAWGEGKTHKDLLSHNIRAGLLLDYNIAKNWSVGAEFDINNLSDRFDSKYNNSCDWMGTAQISLTYKFGHKKCVRPVMKEEPKPVVVEEPKPVVVEKPKPAPAPAVVVKKDEPLREVITFEIRESCPISEAIIEKCNKWLKEYPNKNLTVSGYADKGTGNARLNMMYSKQRTAAAVKALKEAGIPESRIDAKSFGDTVQPFAENDANRCVIIEGIE